MCMKALIVDDDLLVCKGLKQLIPWENLGFGQLLEAHNGKQAYEMSIQHNPDLIISDIKMPVMDGLELCKKLSRTTVDTPVILLSAYEDFEYARTAIQYGVLSYVLKPISKPKIEELIQFIEGISKEKERKREYYAGIFGGDLRARVREALSKADTSYFDNFFIDKMYGPNLNNENLKVVCIGLIDILYNYFEEVGFSAHVVVESKLKALEKVIGMNDTMKMQAYVQEMYLNVTRFAAIKRDNPDESLIKLIQEYIIEHFNDDNLSVASLSDQFHISSSYLSSIFKKEMGSNLSAYITKIRMQKACELLSEPIMKVAQVAELVGYRDPLYFAKVFKKSIGMTPSDYHHLKM